MLEEIQNFLLMNYDWLRAFHIISFICWMAGMLYLPRLYVYHAGAVAGSDLSETLKTMEGRLLRFIMNPAMGATWVFGLLMLWANPVLLEQGWMHGKLLAVVLLSATHGVLSKHRRLFAQDKSVKSGKYFRLVNEIPTILMIFIVIMAVAEPF